MQKEGKSIALFASFVVLAVLILFGVTWNKVVAWYRFYTEPQAVFVPTPQDVVEKMLELANVRARGLVYDLGCGDGRIVVTAAKKYGCKAVGYETDADLVELARGNVKKSEVERLVKIEQRDLFTVDLSKASVVTLYLVPRMNARLISQLETLKTGSRIVSHDSGILGIRPDKVVKCISNEDGAEHTLYLWTAPLRTRQNQGRVSGNDPIGAPEGQSAP